MQLLAAHVALPAICSALTAATDTHTKYHAVGALAACLDQMKALLQASCLLGSRSTLKTLLQACCNFLLELVHPSMRCCTSSHVALR